MKERNSFFARSAFIIITLLVSSGVRAQGSYNLHEKGIERINEARTVAPLSVDEVFGDKISHFDGGVTFSNVDISIPGNESLPVELRRALGIDDRSRINGNHLGGFAEWDLDIPYLVSEVAIAKGWRPAGGTVDQRCSVPGPLEGTLSLAPEDYWGGYKLHVPGYSDQQLLANPSALIPAATGGPYPWITKDMWRISCKSSTKNGYAGQAFIAHSPDGFKYHLDWAVTRAHSSVNGALNSAPVARQVVFFLVSKVEDRFGNWVDYTYSSDKLTGVSSSDGRQITLTWSGNKIAAATSSVGNWSYAYNGESLAQVTLPDASKWAYTSIGAMQINPAPWPSMSDPTGCPDPLADPTANYELTVTAPSGAVGKFTFDVRQHYRSNVPAHACYINSPQYWFMKVPRFHWSLTLTSKMVSGPGLSAMTWSYSYGGGPIMFDHTKKNVVSGPGGTYARYTFGTGFNLNEGQLLVVERGSSAASILRTETNTYTSTTEAAGQNFPASVGTNLREWSDLLSSSWLRPLKQTVISQQGINFKRNVDSCASKLCFDSFSRPYRVTKSSSVSGGLTRTDETAYHDNYAIWVLGQVAQVKCISPVTALPDGCGASGTVVSETTFHPAFALPLVSTRFGKDFQALEYDTASTIGSGQRGTVKAFKDGNNNVTTLSNWKRGIPQTIKYPATPESPSGAIKSAVVGNNGWITSVTDENGYVTNYTYDAMGRLKDMIHPAGDTVAWHTTTRVFEPVAVAEYGIPAGHWRQTVSAGNARNITYFDGLWRPLVTREYDTAAEAITQRFQRFTYDHDGRVTFASYPSAVNNPAAGTWSTYDALGRSTVVRQDWEGTPQLATTTSYLSDAAGHYTLVTDPRGNKTRTWYQSFDQPSYDRPVTVYSDPANTFTHIARDVFGKPTQIRRSNSISPAGGTLALNRTYTYNTNQELCRVVEPEAGGAFMGYDGAGNVAWSASGFATPASGCQVASAVTSRRVDRTYDARNRLKTLVFPDGRGNQTWTYAPDGLPVTVVTANDVSAAQDATNSYSYNRRRLLTREIMQFGSVFTWPVYYAYNGNGHLSSLSWHGLDVNYAPNALGQPTQAGTYATGVAYHPNGGIKEFSYGNGIKRSVTQNTRGLPDTSCDFYGTCTSSAILNDGYDYDQVGNVAAISDGRTGGRGNRSMTYDSLDRLTQVVSPMFGTATYGYDTLDNLTRVKLTGGNQVRDHYYCYDGSWRLTNIKTGNCAGATVMGLGYDAQGNLANKNGRTYTFDYGNRLRSNSGSPGSSYAYDGHGRRVLDQVGTGPKYTHYLQDGRLSMTGDNRAGKVAEYVYLQGSLVAIRERDVVTNVYTTKYQHTDALGSPVAITDQARTVLERTEYEPYGWTANRIARDGPGYTGHVEDAATSLTYMQQRYYDPQIGRFLSVDPVTAYDNPVLAFNRYRYAANNPYKFIDPDGQADIVFFQRDEGLAVTARRFEIPGWFTAMGHAGVIPGDPELKFRDDRMSEKIFTGERLTVNRLVEEIRLGGFDARNDRGVFLGQCSVGSLAIDVARQLGVPVMASEGFVRTVPNNNSGPITYTSNSERDGSGQAMTFNVYTPGGNISRSYSSITMRADGSVWGRQATPETGTRIRKEEKVK